MKHQLDATSAGFISAGSLYMFRAQARIIRSFKTSTAATDTCVIVVGQSSHLRRSVITSPY